MRATRKPPIWEKAKKEKRRGRLIKIGLLFLLLIIAVNLLIRGPAIFKELRRPFDKLQNDNIRSVDIDFSFRANVLIITYSEHWGLTDIAIISYEPGDKRQSALLFNLEGEANKPLRRAAQKIFREEGIGGLQRFISNSLGVPIDRYGAFAGEDLTFSTKQLLEVKKELESPAVFLKIFPTKQKLSKVLKTNVTSGDFWNIFWKARGAKFEEKDAIYLKESKEGNLQSGEVTSQTNNLFLDRKVLEEGAALTIRNSSGKGGLGSTLEHYLTNLGATVVAVEAGEETQVKTLLVVRNSKPEVEKRLQSIINFKEKEAKAEEFSGDILIILGEDAMQELTLP
jgi:hypothetical protein